jgi:diadenosine tetraphosphate (Ap4A) HIT family hydrolase
MSDKPCVFCRIRDEGREILLENRSFFVFYSVPAVNQGHTLIVPKRHMLDPFELTAEEWSDFVELLPRAKAMLDEQHRPDGYNIGINCGRPAGQTVFHLHIHLIPRYVGDVADPRGGICNFKEWLTPYKPEC